ncbi:HD domain-containing phosphohydrolase [Magnetospirillum sp. UT-4]|uniref:HD domain-containing phosphohydrolase n=1 Tax=Magnetospirillum sp. UT-4 TaxID=2681467 RepID=UPI001381FCB5|nr:HD domain-containing phosphohydrolase [Magnetospirillum sp. UT-4]CAA7620701.1 Response regulator receiver:Metal-dependent phosphohydrolase, HD subdomain [Magnetospirillum sp. UT-4]
MRDPSGPPIHLLVVEDNPGDARLVQLQLADAGPFEVSCRGSLAEARAWLADHSADAVLLDLSLPDSSGLPTIDAMRDIAPDLPIIVFTGLDSEDVGMAAVKRGCQDYLVKGHGDGHLIARSVAYSIERKSIERERQAAADQLKRVLLQTVRTVSLALEMRDPYTAGHQKRVAQLAVAIGEHMGLAQSVVEGLHTGALIHDLGKINVPAEFLSRPGKLTAAAFDVVRSHARVGAEIVAGIEFPWPVADMIRQHHERLNGTGYPDGLTGDQIIIEARILAVADVVEAISSHRPYRPSLGIEAAMREIRDHSGSKYDPDVVAACNEVIRANGSQIFHDDTDLPAVWL